MFFYILFAACLTFGRGAHLATAAAIGALVLAGRLWPSEAVLWRFYTDPIVLEFAFGIALHHLFSKFSRLTFHGVWPWLVALTALILLVQMDELCPPGHRSGCSCCVACACGVELEGAAGMGRRAAGATRRRVLLHLSRSSLFSAGSGHASMARRDSGDFTFRSDCNSFNAPDVSFALHFF